jgi:hypothetical protein
MLRPILSLVCVGLLSAGETPAAGLVAFPHLDGSNPASRWARSQSAACALAPPLRMYPGSAAIDEDYRQFPYASGKKSEWIHGGTAQIEAFYDASHRMAIFREFGNDDSYSALFADVGRPLGPVESARLSSIAMTGKIRLGDSQSRVAREFGVSPEFGRPAAAGCSGFRVAAFCSWTRPSCRCPARFVAGRTLGTVVLRNGRVVAMAWDKSVCLP